MGSSTRELVTQSNQGYKQNEGTQLSSVEVHALLGSPHFKHIDRDAVIRAGAKILRTTEKNVEGWRQLSGSDSQNVFACLLAHLNEWADGMEIARTPNGGFMQMRNVRLLELASGKCDRGGRKTDEHGTELPCLEDFGLSICCAMIRGPHGRAWSYFRICHVDEVPRRDGKKIPYTPPLKTGSTDRKKRTESAPSSRQSTLVPIGTKVPAAPAQAAMFETFLSHETGAIHDKGRRA